MLDASGDATGGVLDARFSRGTRIACSISAVAMLYEREHLVTIDQTTVLKRYEREFNRAATFAYCFIPNTLPLSPPAKACPRGVNGGRQTHQTVDTTHSINRCCESRSHFTAAISAWFVPADSASKLHHIYPCLSIMYALCSMP